MEKMLVFKVVLLGLLCFKFGSAQQPAYSSAPDTHILSFISIDIDDNDSKAKGSPYVNECFEVGEVSINDKVQLKEKMRYNAYKNEIEVLDKNSPDSYYSLLKRAYISVEIGDTPYAIYTFVDSNGSVRTSYFSERNQGAIKLLFKPEAILRQGRKPATSYEKYVQPRYIWNNSYYILDNRNPSDNNHAYKVKLKKNSILDFTGGRKEEMKKYIKEQNLNLRREEDVISFLNYFNGKSM